jgi:hypothetical protein
MSQALHIFSKDVRRLWFPLSIALAVQVLFTFFEMQPHRSMRFVTNQFSAETLVDFLLPLAWWYLIAALVHEEAIPGDRQFWITRPYWWNSLLAAKVIFILAFVNLPVLIADCFILTAQGFSVGGHWTGALWRQIPFTFWVLLPPLALGSLTRNLGQVIVAILLVVLRMVVNSIPFHSELPGGNTAIGWIQATVDTIVLVAVLSAVVLIQYRSRRTWLARSLFAAFVIFPGLSFPLRWQLGWQARVKPPIVETSAIRIVFDPMRGRQMPLTRTRGLTQVNVALPVAVSGSPDGVELVSGEAKVNVGGKDFLEGARLERDKKGYWATIVLPADVFASLRNEPVTIRITPIVTAVRHTEFRVPLETGPVQVPFVGICESWRPAPQFLMVYCHWALHSPLRTRIHADYPGWETSAPAGRPREQITGELSDSPFPTGLSLSPVQTAEVFSLAANEQAVATNHPGTQLIFETEHPIAHFQTEIELKPVRLEEYAVMVPEH